MLTEAVVLLKSVIVKGVPRCRSGDPVGSGDPVDYIK
jgi:hypothetical protein